MLGLILNSTRYGNLMAPKRLVRRQLSSSSSVSSLSNNGIEEDDQAKLEPKACLTCGRIVTPRARFARNWSCIRYCSDRCKNWKRLFLIGKIDEQKDTNEKPASLLERCIVKKDSNLFLYLDAWLEATMMQLVSEKSASNKGVALQQVSESIHLDLQSHTEKLSPHYTVIKDKILQQAPGEREMIRRAARRFVILPPEMWAYTKHFGSSLHHIAVSQNHGKHILQNLQDVSFAKGEMYLHRKAIVQ